MVINYSYYTICCTSIRYDDANKKLILFSRSFRWLYCRVYVNRCSYLLTYLLTPIDIYISSLNTMKYEVSTTYPNIYRWLETK